LQIPAELEAPPKDVYLRRLAFVSPGIDFGGVEWFRELQGSYMDFLVPVHQEKVS
jgi:hypothetical protein